MKLLSFTAIFMASVMTLTGCQSVKSVLGKRNNGSLDYRSAQKLDPILLPQGQRTATFTPIYDTPNITSDQVSPITNASGKQYQLPTPPKVH